MQFLPRQSLRACVIERLALVDIPAQPCIKNQGSTQSTEEDGQLGLHWFWFSKYPPLTTT